MGKITELDFKKNSLRKINSFLQNISYKNNKKDYLIKNPRGEHAVCAGLKEDISVNIKGHVGYYCGGMNQKANITIDGNAGTGVGENMMSGSIHIKGNVSQSAGATGHGGTIIIDGDASSRCGISMKGVSIIVKGSVGHMSAFMAQSGTLLICGNAGDALGDSIYETVIYLAGRPKSLGVDCEEKKITKKDLIEIENLLKKGNIKKFKSKNFKKYGSARRLYNFKIDNLSDY